MDPDVQCLGCQIIAEAITNWSNGLIGDTFEVSLGTFAGFEERTNCKVCQFVVQHFKADPMCHPFHPSCSLMLSRTSFNERFWIESVSLATSSSRLYILCSALLGRTLWARTQRGGPMRRTPWLSWIDSFSCIESDDGALHSCWPTLAWHPKYPSMACILRCQTPWIMSRNVRMGDH